MNTPNTSFKILIAVPTYENIYPDTFKSIYDLEVGKNDVAFEFVRGYDCATARNRIAQLSLEYGVDYVLMVDNDVVLPKDALINLIEWNVDVCLGYYAHRDADNIYRGRTCLCKLQTDTGARWRDYPLESEYTGQELSDLRDGGTYKIYIHGGGMGCALIKTDVFRRIKYPWFDWVNYEDKKMLSEDLYFCGRCKENSIPIYADTRVSCGHLLRHIQFSN